MSKKALVRKKIVAIDTETTGLKAHLKTTQTTHISYWTNQGKGHAFPVEDYEQEYKVKELAEDPTVTKVFFNAKYDIRMLSKRGIKVKGPFICLLITARMLLPEEKRINLKHLVRKFLKDPFLEEIRLKQWLKQNGVTAFHLAPPHILIPYSLADAKRTMELFYFFSGGLDKHNLWAVLHRESLLMRATVIPMEDEGIPLDLAEVGRLKIKAREAMQKHKATLCYMTGDPKFNPNSQKQVLAALVKEGIFRPTDYSIKTGKPKADVVSLLEYPSPLGQEIVVFRKISKAVSTYLNKFDQPVLHVSFNQGGTKTGRFSSSGPNLQNIPRPKEDSLLGQMRRCFVAPKGHYLVFIDYNQIELRLAAHFSQEPHMLKAILAGQDLHDKTCMLLYGINPEDPQWDLLRYLSKTQNFSMLYGTGAKKYRAIVLKQTDGKIRLTLQEATKQVTTWKTKHTYIMRLFDKIGIEVAKTGGITTHYGRFIPVDPRKSYVGVNYRIQGTAADFLKLKMLQLVELLRNTGIKLLLQVHDELVFKVPKSQKHVIKDIVSLMEDHTTFSVPLTCSVAYGKNWYDKHKIKFS